MTKLSLDAFEKATEEEMMTVSGCSGFGSAGGSGWLDSIYNPFNFTKRYGGFTGMAYAPAYAPTSSTPAQSSGGYYYLTFGFGLTRAMSENEEKRNREDLISRDSFYNDRGCSIIGTQTSCIKGDWGCVTIGTLECSVPSIWTE